MSEFYEEWLKKKIDDFCMINLCIRRNEEDHQYSHNFLSLPLFAVIYISAK